MVIGLIGGAIEGAVIARAEGESFHKVVLAAERGAALGALTGLLGKFVKPLVSLLKDKLLPHLALWLWGHLGG